MCLMFMFKLSILYEFVNEVTKSDESTFFINVLIEENGSLVEPTVLCRSFDFEVGLSFVIPRTTWAWASQA